jgi:CheY-like chemotaxis protein
MTHIPTLAIADDDELHAELIAAWLEQQGYRVVCFGSGDALLDWAAAVPRRVDAFLLDVDMPGRDGVESCRELRARGEYARVPAVFVSAAGPAGAVECVQYIRKDGELFVHLAAWLAQHLYGEPGARCAKEQVYA